MVSKIRVSGFDYTIEYVNDFIVKNGNEVFAGYCHNDELRFEIGTKYPVPQQFASILHESLHAIGYTYGFDMAEDVVKKLTYALFAFIKDNPEFIKDIWEKG